MTPSTTTNVVINDLDVDACVATSGNCICRMVLLEMDFTYAVYRERATFFAFTEIRQVTIVFSCLHLLACVFTTNTINQKAKPVSSGFNANHVHWTHLHSKLVLRCYVYDDSSRTSVWEYPRDLVI